MNTSITEWLETRTGETRRQMALKLGHTPSTYNRNIDTAELITATCRAYGLNPVEGLIVAGIVSIEEVQSAAGRSAIETVPEESLLEEVLRRAIGRKESVLNKAIMLDDEGMPDYSGMSEADANDYDLAAGKKDQQIADDATPHTS